jgi:hypothetical protein
MWGGARLVLGGALGGVLLAAALALRGGADDAGSLARFAALLVAAAGLVAGLRLAEPTRSSLALAIVSTAAALYSAEGVLRWLEPARPPVPEPCRRLSDRGLCPAAHAAGLPFDSRSKLEVMAELEGRSGERAGSGFPPRRQVHMGRALEAEGAPLFALAGPSRSLIVDCNETGAWLVYRSDEHGFRNPPGLYDGGRLDVAVVGDSFAHGTCVADGEDVAGVLRAAGLRSLNLGEPGNGPLVELATVREFAAPLRARLVAWLWFEGNDVADLADEVRLPLLRVYLDDGGFGQGLLARQPAVDRAVTRFLERQRRRAEARERARAPAGARPAAHPLLRFALLGQLRTSIARARRRLARPPEPVLDAALLRDILAAARDATRAAGGRLLFVTLPPWERFGQPRAAVRQPERSEAVLALARELGLATLDGVEILERDGDPLELFPFRGRGHYTPAGYRRLAEAIRAQLPPPARPSGDPR